MLRTMLLLAAGVMVTAGLVALVWAARALGAPAWRGSSALATPSMGLGGVALLAASLLALRLSGRVDGRSDPRPRDGRRR